MTSFKPVSLAALVLTLAVAAVSSLSNDNSKNNLILGQRESGDRIIYQENIAVTLHITGKEIILNRAITAPANYYITQIVCLDQVNDGRGAEPTVTGGGPKQSFVNLSFKSQRWNGIYFKVEVYGKPK